MRRIFVCVGAALALLASTFAVDAAEALPASDAMLGPDALDVADVDGDGKGDVFAYEPSNGAWLVSYAGISAWTVVNHGTLDRNRTWLADMNGDRKADVFTQFPDGRWMVSHSAKESWVQYNGSLALDPARTRLGDLNGDLKADVLAFSADGVWRVSYGGNTAWQVVNNGAFNPPERTWLADMNGDGRDDVFAQLPDGRWMVSHSASSAWTQLNGADALDPARTWLADLNGDARDDVFTQFGDGRWMVSHSGTSPWVQINGSEALDGNRTRLSDMNGDGREDLFNVDSSCAWRISYSAASGWSNINNGCPFRSAAGSVISGVIKDETGLGTAGATLMVTAYPFKGDAGQFNEQPLGQTQTGTNGAFSLSVPAPIGQSFTDTDGLVSLQFHVTNPDGTGYVHQTLAVPPHSSTSTWTLLNGDSQPNDGLVTRVIATSKSRRAALTLTPPNVTERFERRSGRPVNLDVSAARSEAASRTTQVCGGSWPLWVTTGVTTTRMVPVQRTRTLGKSKVSYEWSSTKNTQLDAAVSGKAGAYSVGLQYVEDHTVGTGMSPSSGNNVSQLIRQEFEYKKLEAYCYNPGLGSGRHPSGTYRWVPTRWTGGNDKLSVSDNWTCDTKWSVEISSPVWVARSSSVSYSGYFGIGGAQLKSKQINSSSHKVTYSPNNSSTTARLCGRGDYPISAAQVKEVS